MSSANCNRILGVNLYHGDASAALMVDGVLVGAVEEERFTRVKHAAGIPFQAIAALLDQAGVGLEEIDAIAVGRDSRAHLFRKATFVATNASAMRKNVLDKVKIRMKAASLPVQLAQHFDIKSKSLKAKMVAVEHHKAHLASAYHFSGKDSATAITIDGFGDFVSTMWARCEGSKIVPYRAVYFPHSLGILYQAVTQYIGFPWYGDEGKVMGLAPYGEPVYVDKFHELIRPAGGGRFLLNPLYFSHARKGVKIDFSGGTPVIGPLYTKLWEDLFERPPHTPEATKADPLNEWVRNMAASVQTVVERYVFSAVRAGWDHDQNPNLCLAGGVALNSVANGKISERAPFQAIYVHPAAGDGGIAAGAAAWAWRERGGKPIPMMQVPYTGSEYSREEVLDALAGVNLKADGTEQLLVIKGAEVKCRCSLVKDDRKLYKETAGAMANGEVVGWFQGRMEFGPRALGNRSILADPRKAEMKDILNQRVKHREVFRPFAPSVLLEETGSWFEKTMPSPAMLMVYKVRKDKRDKVPAITHVDGTGRLQTVDAEHAPRYAGLIRSFFEQTGVPMVLNTSFNENEPIVRTPEDALYCFAKTKIDCLVMENIVLERIKP